MKSYNQSELFQVLISAARNRNGWCADPVLLARYKKNRLIQAVQALRTRNLFLYTEGSRPSTVLNSQLTLYTQPAGTRLILCGYSDNFRYGNTAQPVNNFGGAGGETTAVAYPATHRVKIVGPRGARPLVDDLVPSQMGVSGEPRWTSTLLTVPEIVEPDEQLAVDLGYDTNGTAPSYVLPQAFTFFTLKVKDKLTPKDEDAIAECAQYITAHDFQRGVYLNCGSNVTPNAAASSRFVAGLLIFDSGVAGGNATGATRQIGDPLLITGVGTNLNASKIKITDTADGYSFSLDKFIQSSSINMPDVESVEPTLPSLNVGIAPSAAPTWTNYFPFPMPHLLKPGAQLRAEVVNGGLGPILGAGVANNNIDGVGGATDPVIYFQGMTV